MSGAIATTVLSDGIEAAARRTAATTVPVEPPASRPVLCASQRHSRTVSHSGTSRISSGAYGSMIAGGGWCQVPGCAWWPAPSRSSPSRQHRPRSSAFPGFAGGSGRHSPSASRRCRPRRTGSPPCRTPRAPPVRSSARGPPGCSGWRTGSARTGWGRRAALLDVLDAGAEVAAVCVSAADDHDFGAQRAHRRHRPRVGVGVGHAGQLVVLGGADDGQRDAEVAGPRLDQPVRRGRRRTPRPLG